MHGAAPLMNRSGIVGGRLPWNLFDRLERIPGVRALFGHIRIPSAIGDPQLAPVKVSAFIIHRLEVAACPRAPFVEHLHGDAGTWRAFPFVALFLQPEDVPVDPVAARDEPEAAVRVAPASRRVGHGGEPGPGQVYSRPLGSTERRGPFQPLPGQDHAGIRVAHPEIAGFHAGHDRFLVRIPPQSRLIRFPMVAHSSSPICSSSHVSASFRLAHCLRMLFSTPFG